MKNDNYALGVLIGLTLPFSGFFLFYKWRFGFFSFNDFLDLLFQQKSILSAMISFSLILNGAALAYFFQKRLDQTAKGIFFTTCIYAIIAIAYKWFL